jgi:hypothetical protein
MFSGQLSFGRHPIPDRIFARRELVDELTGEFLIETHLC